MAAGIMVRDHLGSGSGGTSYWDRGEERGDQFRGRAWGARSREVDENDIVVLSGVSHPFTKASEGWEGR